MCRHFVNKGRHRLFLAAATIVGFPPVPANCWGTIPPAGETIAPAMRF
jgi:hypothetical protein